MGNILGDQKEIDRLNKEIEDARFQMEKARFWNCVFGCALFFILVAFLWNKLAYFEEEERCTNQWTNHSVNTLKRSLDSNLFGQHLVNNIVYKKILGHLNDENPKKALVLSFHGWPGSGKNYVSDFIVEHVFKKGIESKYFHKFVTTKHFSNTDELSIKEYKELIKTEIESKVRMCPRSMFVFDETGMMPKGLSDVLAPYLDFHPQLDGIDYRKAIFIFLSNTGGDIINKEAVKHFKAGKSRESITSKQMEQVLSARVLYRKEGGLQDSELILRSFVDFYIPFLPLERKHVKQCAEVAIKRRNRKVEADVLDCVSNEMQYFPKDRPLFSQKGCKEVDGKVDICL